MAETMEASVSIHEFSGDHTRWERCVGHGERYRFDITRSVTMWFRPGYRQDREDAVTALRRLAARASELADAIQDAERTQADG
jgi:hypothetical protein